MGIVEALGGQFWFEVYAGIIVACATVNCLASLVYIFSVWYREQ